MFRRKNWNDWALFKWTTDDGSTSDESTEIPNTVDDNTEDIPGRILFFFDARKMKNHPHYDPGLYAIIQSLTKKPTGFGKKSFIGRGTVNPRVTFQVCHVDSIVDVAFLIPNIGLPNEYLVLKPPVHWADIFIK